MFPCVLLFTFLTISNACGMIYVIYSLGNGPHIIELKTQLVDYKQYVSNLLMMYPIPSLNVAYDKVVSNERKQTKSDAHETQPNGFVGSLLRGILVAIVVVPVVAGLDVGLVEGVVEVVRHIFGGRGFNANIWQFSTTRGV
ncbi:Superoxide dismutase [Mn] [Bienertia sinuspersici]